MLALVNGLVFWSAVVTLLTLLPAASAAQDKEEKARQPGENRWVPSLALTSGITIQSQQGSFEAFDLAGMPIVEPTEGDDLAVSPYVGANLELMSPALPLPGRPRLFLGAEVLPTFGPTRDVAKVGDPSGFNPPDIAPPTPPETLPRLGYSEEAILGVGGATTAEIDTLVFGAALGVAFPFEWLGRPFRVKPSAGWIRYKIDVSGRVLDAQCVPSGIANPATYCISYDSGGPSSPPPAVFGYTREITLVAEDSKRFDGIGGGLDLEMDTGRVGPLGVSLFLGGRFYRTLGNRTVELSKSASYDDPIGTDTFTANWSFEADPWMYRVGLGLRVHWLGSQK